MKTVYDINNNNIYITLFNGDIITGVRVRTNILDAQKPTLEALEDIPVVNLCILQLDTNISIKAKQC